MKKVTFELHLEREAEFTQAEERERKREKKRREKRGVRQGKGRRER